MALHPDFPDSPHAILDPAVRWFPADEALRDTSMDKLMPPLVAQAPMVVGSEDELLAIGVEVRDQFAFALSGVDWSLATKVRGLPVVMKGEGTRGQESLADRSEIQRLLLRTDLPSDNDLLRCL